MMKRTQKKTLCFERQFIDFGFSSFYAASVVYTFELFVYVCCVESGHVHFFCFSFRLQLVWFICQNEYLYTLHRRHSLCVSESKGNRTKNLLFCLFDGISPVNSVKLVLPEMQSKLFPMVHEAFVAFAQFINFQIEFVFIIICYCSIWFRKKESIFLYRIGQKQRILHIFDISVNVNNVKHNVLIEYILINK